MEKLSFIPLLFFGIIILSSLSSAYFDNSSTVYLQINDVYTFNSDGNFTRDLSTWITHNDLNKSRGVVYRNFFPSPTEEYQPIIGNVSYLLYLNGSLNQSISRLPQDDFKKGEVIYFVNSLKGKEEADMERIYNAYSNPEGVFLGLDVLLNNTASSYCLMDNSTCATYNLASFSHIVKLPKSKGFAGAEELVFKNRLSLPDMVYDDGGYRVYVWKGFPLNAGNFEQVNIGFSYTYEIPSWLWWALITTFIGIIIGGAIGFFTGFYFDRRGREEKV